MNPYHQVRKECNLMERQQVMLDNAVCGRLLENGREDIDDWLQGKNEKGKLQTIDLEMM